MSQVHDTGGASTEEHCVAGRGHRSVVQCVWGGCLCGVAMGGGWWVHGEPVCMASIGCAAQARHSLQDVWPVGHVAPHRLEAGQPLKPSPMIRVTGFNRCDIPSGRGQQLLCTQSSRV